MKKIIKNNWLLGASVAAYFLLLALIRVVVGSGLVWDETWYANIITNGYSFASNQQSTVAFFPVYPLLVKAISLGGFIPVRFVGLAVNYFAAFGICWFALGIAQQIHSHLDKHTKTLIVSVILLFPTSFFFTALYADCLLAFLVTGSIYFALRKQYIHAFIFAGFASGTKFTGIAAVVCCMVIYATYENRAFIKMLMYGLIGASGLLTYVLFLQLKFGNPAAFIEAQSSWGRNNGFFLHSLWRQFYGTPKHLFDNAVSKSFIISRLFSICIALCSFPIGYMLARKKIWWAVALVAIIIGTPLISGNFDSISRYFLVALPALAAIFIPIYFRKKRVYVYAVFLGISIIMQLAFYVYFLEGKVFIS